MGMEAITGRRRERGARVAPTFRVAIGPCVITPEGVPADRLTTYHHPVQRRHDVIRDLEDRFIASDRLDHARALALYEGMWEEARQLGVMPPKDPWEGLDVDLRIASTLARCSPIS